MNYNLQKLIAQTASIEIKHPISGEPTGIMLDVLPADSPKIAETIAIALGCMPPFPSDSAPIGDLVKYNNADKIANRTVVCARVIASNDDGLQSPAQRQVFFDNCDYSIIEQIQSDGADRNLYFR